MTKKKSSNSNDDYDDDDDDIVEIEKDDDGDWVTRVVSDPKDIKKFEKLKEKEMIKEFNINNESLKATKLVCKPNGFYVITCKETLDFEYSIDFGKNAELIALPDGEFEMCNFEKKRSKKIT